METVCEFDRLFSRNVPHIQEKMFLSLDFTSFINCLEVCKSWNDLLISKPFKKMNKNIFSLEIHTQLIKTAEEGNIDLIHKILSTFIVDVNRILEMPGTRNHKMSFTSLAVASQKGHKHVVQLLLDRGADPNLVVGHSDSGLTSLHIAALTGHKVVAHLLLDKGAMPNMVSKDGSTSLLLASGRGHTEVVQLLLDRGAAVNMANLYGQTELHYAAKYGHKDVVQHLLDRGANPNVADQIGWNPLIYAASLGCSEPWYAESHRHNDVAQLLLARGADPNIADQNGVAPLHYTVYRGNKDFAQLLISKGADPNLATANGLTPLFCAVLGLKQRLEHLGPIETQLLVDAKEEYKDIIQLLLDNGANTNIADPDGSTPLVYAEDMEYMDIAKILRDHKGKKSNLRKT